MMKIIIKILIITLIISIVILCVCSVDNTDAATTTLADTVINLSSGTTYTAGNGNGVYYTNSHEYRYVGGEVNNYVSFNGDLYRIIGVFDSNSTGVSGNLVKLIMANKLTSAAWGIYNSESSGYTTYSSYKNDWTGTTTGVLASANLILNEYFLNATNTSSTYGMCVNWIYAGTGSKTKNCTDIKGYGIKTQAIRNYIQPVTWYLYGYSSVALTKANWYKCERNNYSNCKSGNSGAYSGTITASIGLMYVSDYMYASGSIASNDYSINGNGQDFMGKNWLYNGYEWTITPKSSNNSQVFNISNAGRLYEDYSYYGFGIRPTFYLKSSVYVTGGDGSFHNPYTIACDDCNS